MANVMEALYVKWAEDEIKVSPEYKSILEKYGSKNFNEYYAIADAVAEEQKLAFEAGFRTAVQLLWEVHNHE